MRMLTEEFKRTWLVVKVIFIAFGILGAIAALPLALLVGFVVFISGLIYRASSGRDAENAEKMRGGVDQNARIPANIVSPKSRFTAARASRPSLN